MIAQTITSGCVTLVTEVCWGGAISYFYLRCLGLSAKYMTIVLAAFAVWNAVDNLIAGYIIDRAAKKTVRRVIFIRICGLATGIFYALAFLKIPFVTSQIGLAISAFIMMCMLDFMVAFLENCLFAIPLEETLDNGLRGKVLSFETVADLISTCVPILIMPMLMPDSGQSITVFSGVMCSIGLCIGVAVFVASFFIDSTYKKQDLQPGQKSSLKYIINCFKSRAFWGGEIFSIGLASAYALFIIGMYYYFDEVPSSEIACYIAAAAGAGGMYVVYFKCKERLGIKWFCILSSILSGAMILAGMLCGPRVISGIIAFAGAGVAYISNEVFLTLMMGDIADHEEYVHGWRYEGIYYGLDNFLCSISNAAQSVFLATLLAFGYIEHQPAGTQSYHVQEGIIFSWLFWPGVILIGTAIIGGILYPYGKTEIQSVKKNLTNRREMKKVSL